jgi:hypothetical protein
MQNKRLYLMLGLTVLLVGAAAFLAGRMFSTGPGHRSESGALENGQVFVSMNDITPAPELPTTAPEINGLFVERKDNTVIVQIVSFDAGLGGIAGNASQEGESGPKVEVIVTGETTVYQETTEFSNPVAGQEFSIRQTVEEATLDDLNTQTMITVWGRKNGDRVIAEVFLYVNPLMIKKP